MRLEDQTTDVVIIGAGVAGLRAAENLKQNNINFVVLEASHRIGGRAYSEKLGPENWFDLGCSYLHNGKLNPFVKIAKSLDIQVNTTNGDLFDATKTKYFSNGKKLEFQNLNPVESAYNEVIKKISHVHHDCSIFENMDMNNPYSPILLHLFSGSNAADSDLVSSRDYISSHYDGPDYPIPSSLGNLVKAWSSGINVNLNTVVKKIYWDDSSVKVITSKGTFFAKKVLLTVSTSILFKNDITIIPELPAEKRKAIENLPMGTLNKIGISFNKGTFSKKDRGWYVSWPGNEIKSEADIGSFEVNVSGLDNIVVFAGGRFGEWLEKRGAKTMRDYAITKVEEVLGSKYLKNIEKTITTAWASDPFSKGSYSYASPSSENFRSELRKPICDTLYFAGEATINKHFGTAHGAYFSGTNASNEIITGLSLMGNKNH